MEYIYDKRERENLTEGIMELDANTFRGSVSWELHNPESQDDKVDL
jgi:hypothetical protein